MRISTVAVVVVPALAAAFGCYSGTDAAPSSSGNPGGSASPTIGAESGLPCDVAAALTASCTSCHGSPPTGGAPSSLVSYEDLTAASKSDPSRPMVEVAIERMKSATNPMPPGGGAPATAIQALETWVAAGTPRGTCDASGGGTAFDTPLVCTSNQHWTRGDHGSSSMHPGVACIQCHAEQGGEAPRFAVAGTVYPTAHEPDDCYGDATGVSVVIKDATGKQLTLAANAVGNFSTRSSLTFPLKVQVVNGAKTRAMAGDVPNGDCNGCHTEQGANDAPGRIVAP